LLVDPPSLLDPGFQLSFAATLALVALVEKRFMAALPMLERGRFRSGVHHLVTLLLASVVAEAATTPLVISMFNNLSLYGVFANAVATPLVSLFLMPTVALFFILLPLGLHGFALGLLNYGIKALLALAHWVAGLPYAQWFVPSLPSYGVALFVLGLLWLCLWQTRARRYGLVAMVLGVASVFTVTLPDVLVSGSLKQVAFKTADGYVLARGRPSALLPELWANGLGYKELPPAEAPQWRCDALGCVALVKGLKIAFPNDTTALLEDCGQANVIVSTAKHQGCAGNVRLLNPAESAQGNVMALWLSTGGITRVETSEDWQGKRPWSVSSGDADDED
jgi:competence protein ComEC